MDFRSTLARVTGLLAGPYGYTVSLGGAAALVSARWGAPGVPDVLLFAGGAIAAYLLLALWARPAQTAAVPQPVSAVLTWNALPLVALTAGLLASALPWRGVAFAATGAAVTGAYVLALALWLTRFG